MATVRTNSPPIRVLCGCSPATTRTNTWRHPTTLSDAHECRLPARTGSRDTQQHSKQLALGQRAGGVDPRTVCRAVAGSQTLVSPPLDDRTAREPRRVWGWPPHADASGYSDRSECRTPIGLEQTMTPFERVTGRAPVLLQLSVPLSTTDEEPRSPADHVFAGQRTFLTEI